LKIVAGAIVDREALNSGRRTIAFYRNRTGSGWGTVRAGWAKRNEKAGNPSTRIGVAVVDFAAATKDHGIPHYMKIDIEGCDTICLNALVSFHERPDDISIESDKTSFRNISDGVLLFESLGYKTFQAVEQSAVISQAPPSPASEGNYAPHKFDSAASGLFGCELPGKWTTRRKVLRLYRMIRFGYYVLGDYGLLNRAFLGAGLLRKLARALLRPLIRERFQAGMILMLASMIRATN
jgi:hypothetical protein